RSDFPDRTEVFGVRDELTPDGFVAFRGRLPDGEMGHEVVWRGAVPMPLAGRRLDRVARPDLQPLPAASLDEPDAVEDVKRLPACVGMPAIPRSGREPHDADAHLRRRLAAHDDVIPDVAGEVLRRGLGRRLLGNSVHLVSPFTFVAQGGLAANPD